jgi:hypothetical protein
MPSEPQGGRTPSSNMRGVMKQVDLLLDYYENKHIERTNKPSGINRIREKWNVKEMLESIGASRARDVINQFFSTKRSRYDITLMLYNYDSLLQMHELQERDRDRRIELAKQTKERVERLKNESRG